MRGSQSRHEKEGNERSDDADVRDPGSTDTVVYDRDALWSPSIAHLDETICHARAKEVTSADMQIPCSTYETNSDVKWSCSQKQVTSTDMTVLRGKNCAREQRIDMHPSGVNINITAANSSGKSRGNSGTVKHPHDNEANDSLSLEETCNNPCLENLRSVLGRGVMISSTLFDSTFVVDEGEAGALAEYERFITQNPIAARRGYREKSKAVSPERVISYMKGNIDDPDVLQKQLLVLHNLSIDDDSRNRIGTCGGILVSIDLMRTHPMNEPLVIQILAFLSEVCQTSQKNKLQLGQCHGLAAIVNCIRDCRNTSSDLNERACEALCISCVSCPSNQTAAGECGAIQALLTVLRQRKESMLIQEECLRALFHLTLDHSPNIILLDENGGPEEIIAACRHYSFDAGFQATTFNLTHSLLRQSPRLRISLSVAGIIDEISSILPLLYTSKPFIKACAGTLRFLAFHGTIRKAICLTTVIEALATSLSHHYRETNIVHPLLLALGNLTFDPPSSKKRACTNKNLVTFHNILSYHTTHTVITAQCLRLLRNISDGQPSTRRTILRCNTPKFITQAMQALPGAVAVQEHGAAALINLTRINSELVRSDDLEDHIERAINLHADSTAAQKQLIFLRDALSSRVTGLAKLFSRGGSTVSRISSTTTAPEVEMVLRDTAVANAMAALEKESDVVEY